MIDAGMRVTDHNLGMVAGEKTRAGTVQRVFSEGRNPEIDCERWWVAWDGMREPEVIHESWLRPVLS